MVPGDTTLQEWFCPPPMLSRLLQLLSRLLPFRSLLLPSPGISMSTLPPPRLLSHTLPRTVASEAVEPRPRPTLMWSSTEEVAEMPLLSLVRSSRETLSLALVSTLLVRLLRLLTGLLTRLGVTLFLRLLLPSWKLLH